MKNSNKFNVNCEFCDSHKGCDNCHYGQTLYECKQDCRIDNNGSLLGWVSCDDVFCRKCGKKLNIQNIQSMDKKFWSDSKKVLEHKINQVKGFEKVTIRRFNSYIEVSGTITFKFGDDCEIILWNTSSGSGGEITLTDLNKIQGLIKEWWTEEME